MRQKVLYWLPLALVMAGCSLVLTVWAFVVPIFESPDEPHHWKNAQYIHSHLALPPYNADYLEAPQGPLYYLVVAPLAASTPVPPILKHVQNESDLGFTFANVPGIEIDSQCWPHFFANCPQDLYRYWPIRLVRLVTEIFALIAVLFTAMTAFEMTKSLSCAVMAAALMGFLPQFDFRGASVNNDPAMICFAAIATYLMVRMLIRGFTLNVAIAACITIALSFLSKISAAVLVPVFITCIFLTASNWQTRFRRCLLLLISGLIILPWIIRNKLVLGDFLGEGKIARTVPMMVHHRSITDPYFRTYFLQLTSRSFFGYFGWMTLKMPGIIYREYALLFVVAAAGLLFVLVRRGAPRRIIVVLAILPILSFAFLIYASLNYPQPQGRLLYASLTAIMVLAALGLGAIRQIRKYVAVAVVFGCLAINVYALAKVVYPAYWLDKPVQTRVDASVVELSAKDSVPEPVAASHRFVQSFVAAQNGLSAVEAGIMADGKVSGGHLRLCLSKTKEGTPFATVELPASSIESCCRYAHLDFPPITDSAGKEYFLSLSSKDLKRSNGIAILQSSADVYPRGEFSIDGKDTGRDIAFRTFYTRPCWTCR